ncbi:MAG: tryptophan--tRNA ligase [Acidimicrobiia bacterium]
MSAPERKTVFSGIQPDGKFHIGNYLGALRNWVRLQDEYDSIYCVVDLHAITVPLDRDELHRDRLEAAKVLLAVGIDPDRSLLYYQSQVPQHTELAWILGTIASTGQLSRMTQFKEKADKFGANLGLYAYPVLMAADILLFRAQVVPVGEDQTQHLELTRDLAQRFNHRYGEEFPLPEPIIPETGARIMSLQDPTAKMSKSDPDPASRVLVVDDPDTIRDKFKAAVTDSGRDVRYNWEAKPGISNLLEILSLFTDTPIEQLEREHVETLYAEFKEVVAEAVIDGLAEFRAAYEKLDDEDVAGIMESGAAAARDRAEPFLDSVRRRLGLTG